MKRALSVLPVSGLVFVALLLPQAYSQDAKKPEAKTAAPKSEPVKPDSTSAKTDASPTTKKGRLPNNYGKLDLSDEQRDKIYGIQARHQGAIDKLEKQLEELKEKQATDLFGILTKPQQAKLNELSSSSKKKKDDSSSASAVSENEKPKSP